MLSREELLKMREMTFEDIDPKEIQDVEKLITYLWMCDIHGIFC